MSIDMEDNIGMTVASPVSSTEEGGVDRRRGVDRWWGVDLPSLGQRRVHPDRSSSSLPVH